MAFGRVNARARVPCNVEMIGTVVNMIPKSAEPTEKRHMRSGPPKIGIRQRALQLFERLTDGRLMPLMPLLNRFWSLWRKCEKPPPNVSALAFRHGVSLKWS
jgi:hypothetical protein